MLRMLDTDIAGYLIKGNPVEVQRHALMVAPQELCISAVTKAELLYGLKRLPQEHRLHTVVQRFLRLLPVLPWDADAAAWYADIRYRLVSGGQAIGEMDMMIAAHALSVGATLVTHNTRHYGCVGAGLLLEDWTTPVPMD